jgi:SAM-dependent methyltransferase
MNINNMSQQQWPDIFPPLPNSTEMPNWTGHGFRIGDRLLPILSYEAGASGWTDELTTFHENFAGNSHFIDLASRRQAVIQVSQYATGASPVILDIGCSSGFLLAEIIAKFPRAHVMGADVVHGTLLNLAKTSPEIPLLHFDLTRSPLPNDCIDVAILLNVLEHIKDDTLAVRQLFRILKPGGIAIIEVPAGPELYDIYDELLMHYRRYRLPGLRRLFLDASFSVLRQSHLGFFLYPGFFLVKQLRRKKRARIPEEEIPVLVSQNINQTGDNPFFHALMHIELAAGKAVSYPFGIRCLLTVQKPIQL